MPCQGIFVDCSLGPTIEIPCEDNNPATINDIEIVSECNGDVCIPCMGTPTDCNTGPTTVQSCDDNDPCTINDVETILDGSTTICVPCIGTPAPCGTDGSCEMTQACDDGDPCSIDDFEIVLEADGSICVPCQGTLSDCSTGATSVVTCDDWNPATINDMQTILDCDGSICIPCIGEGAPMLILPPNWMVIVFVADGNTPNTLSFDIPNLQNPPTETGLISEINLETNGNQKSDQTAIIPNFSSIDDFNLFPNPSNGKVNLAIDFNENLDIRIQLVNLMGQEIKTIQFQNVNSIYQTFDWEELPKGIYWLSISSNDNRLVKRILLE